MNGVQTVLNDVENIFYTKKIKPQPQKFYKDIYPIKLINPAVKLTKDRQASSHSDNVSE